jgi:Ca2+-binding RTX toxin-like protein
MHSRPCPGSRIFTPSALKQPRWQLDCARPAATSRTASRPLRADQHLQQHDHQGLCQASWRFYFMHPYQAMTSTDFYNEGNNFMTTIYGTETSDSLSGGAGNDTLYGYGGDDRLDSYEGSDVLDGGTGNDTLNSSGGDDLLDGGDGSDVLDGGSGNDTLDGGVGNDMLRGAGGNDVYLFGRGSGQDTILESNATTGNVDTVRFADGVSPANVSYWRDQDHLYFKINGTDDTLCVQSFYTAYGYQIEEVVFADGTVWKAADLKAGAVFYGTDASDNLSGGAGDDILIGYGGNDTLDGGNDSDGNDVLYGGTGNDILSGRGGNDWLDGGDGSDVLDGGGTGNDTLNGGADNDSLYGSSGNNTFDGGAGNDILQDGGGNDVYLFGRGSGQDTILESNATTGNVDTVRFADGVSPANVSYWRDQDHLYFKINGTDDTLCVQYFYTAYYYQIEEVVFADGTVWKAADLKANLPKLRILTP